MGEHIFRVLLTEIEIVRLTCLGCGGIAELHHNEIAKRFTHTCPFCQKALPTATLQSLAYLQNALRDLRDPGGGIRVEFPISLDSKAST